MNSEIFDWTVYILECQENLSGILWTIYPCSGIQDFFSPMLLLKKNYETKGP